MPFILPVLAIAARLAWPTVIGFGILKLTEGNGTTTPPPGASGLTWFISKINWLVIAMVGLTFVIALKTVKDILK